MVIANLSWVNFINGFRRAYKRNAIACFTWALIPEHSPTLQQLLANLWGSQIGLPTTPSHFLKWCDYRWGWISRRLSRRCGWLWRRFRGYIREWLRCWICKRPQLSKPLSTTCVWPCACPLLHLTQKVTSGFIPLGVFNNGIAQPGVGHDWSVRT